MSIEFIFILSMLENFTYSSGNIVAPGLNIRIFDRLLSDTLRASSSLASFLSLQSYSSRCFAVLSSTSCASTSFRVLLNWSLISAVKASSLMSSSSTSSRHSSGSRRPVLRSRHSPAAYLIYCWFLFSFNFNAKIIETAFKHKI